MIQNLLYAKTIHKPRIYFIRLDYILLMNRNLLYLDNIKRDS